MIAGCIVPYHLLSAWLEYSEGQHKSELAEIKGRSLLQRLKAVLIVIVAIGMMDYLVVFVFD